MASCPRVKECNFPEGVGAVRAHSSLSKVFDQCKIYQIKLRGEMSTKTVTAKR